tara:strand:+ start:1174 stop:2985 length:1812 start_codon:yes stop_codon:yes gene_type:complete
MTAKTEKLKQIIADLPQKPGVYQYFDVDQKIIYVGKAKKLKNRVSSYFNKIKHESGKTRLLVSKIVDIKFIVVETEYDALLLENTLIKKHQPRYNILLRDDKTYPWICIKKERFPRVFYTRKLIRDGSDYFGPYASVKTIRTLIELLNKLYRFRTCSYFLSKESVDKKKFKPCLEHHIGNCKAPCANLQTEDDYNQSVAHAKGILKGNYKDVLVSLKEKIAILVKDLKFEQAEEIKQQIDALDNFQSRSTVVHPTINNVDVFSIVTDDKYGYVNYLRVMSGSIVQSHTIELRKRLDETEENLLEIAIGELRTVFNSDSKELFTSVELDLEIPGVELHFPQRGDKKKLIELSLKNAKYFMLDRHRAQDKIDPDRKKNRVLTQIKDDLRLAELPDHIECFDNSNIQGSYPVAACVVFIGGKPAKKMYRKFEIKTVVGPDDFASMEEVVYRRYKRLLDENKPLPQLVIIDGGKGQLSSAMKSIDKLGIRGRLTVIGIAKRLEEIFFPGDSIPLYIDKKSESLKVIQQLRNEAHRFGITFHRQKRDKSTLVTSLTSIEGIGETAATKLLAHFKSVKRVKEATIDELTEAVNNHQAQIVFAHHNPTKE